MGRIGGGEAELEWLFLEALEGAQERQGGALEGDEQGDGDAEEAAGAGGEGRPESEGGAADLIAPSGPPGEGAEGEEERDAQEEQDVGGPVRAGQEGRRDEG